MAATVSNLREILETVEPPVMLIDRRFELPNSTSFDLEELKRNPSIETAKRYMETYLKEMKPDANEVYPNVFIGNYGSIMSLEFLKSIGITHVLNLGENDPLKVAPIIDPESLPGIAYQKLDVSDIVDLKHAEVQIKNFNTAADIIEKLLSEDTSKVLVNCFGGISRSSSAVATYLILKKGMTAQEALTTMKKKRDVWPSNPNLAFLARISNEKHGYPINKESELEDISIRTILKSKK